MVSKGHGATLNKSITCQIKRSEQGMYFVVSYWAQQGPFIQYKNAIYDSIGR